MPNNSPRTEDINEIIARLLGLSNASTLDDQTYVKLLIRKLATARLIGKELPAEEDELLREELKIFRKKLKNPGRFKVRVKKVTIGNSTPPPPKPSPDGTDGPKGGPDPQKSQGTKLLPSVGSIVRYQKIQRQKPKEEAVDNEVKIKKESPGLKILQEINDRLGSILNTLKSQYAFDQRQSEKSRKESENKKRGKGEFGLESLRKGFGALKNIATKMLSPFQSIFDKIWKWVFFTLLGRAFNDFMNWMSDAENRKKISNIFKFFTKHWVAFAGIYLLFGTSLGKFVRGILKVVARGMVALAMNIPRIISFIRKNKKLSFLALAAAPLVTREVSNIFSEKGDTKTDTDELKPKEFSESKAANDEISKQPIQKFNLGGMIPKFKLGGMVPKFKLGGMNYGSFQQGVPISGAGQDNTLIAAKTGEAILTEKDQKDLSKNYVNTKTGENLNIPKYLSGRKPGKVSSDKIKVRGGYLNGGIIDGFANGGIVGTKNTRRRVKPLTDVNPDKRLLRMNTLWHGTNDLFKNSIMTGGIDPLKYSASALGEGFYTTPDIKIARLYAQQSAASNPGTNPAFVRMRVPQPFLDKRTRQVNKPEKLKYSHGLDPNQLLQYTNDFKPGTGGNTRTSSMYVWGGRSNRYPDQYRGPSGSPRIGDWRNEGLPWEKQYEAANYANKFLKTGPTPSVIRSKNAAQRWGFRSNKLNSKPTLKAVPKTAKIPNNTSRKPLQAISRRVAIPSSSGQNQLSSFNRYRPGATIRATGPGMERYPELQRFSNPSTNIPRNAKVNPLMKVLNNPVTRTAGKALRILDAPVVGDMILPDGTSQYSQRDSVYNDPRLSPYQRRISMESVGLRGGGMLGGYGLKEQSFENAPQTQIMRDGLGNSFVGYKAMKNGKLTYIRGSQAGANSSNIWENIGRSINPDAYKENDAKLARQKNREAMVNSLEGFQRRGMSADAQQRMVSQMGGNLKNVQNDLTYRQNRKNPIPRIIPTTRTPNTRGSGARNAAGTSGVRYSSKPSGNRRGGTPSGAQTNQQKLVNARPWWDKAGWFGGASARIKKKEGGGIIEQPNTRESISDQLRSLTSNGLSFTKGFINENSGMNVPGGTSDRQAIFVQPGEYVIPKEAVPGFGGVSALDKKVAEHDRNSNPFKMGALNSKLPKIEPYKNSSSGKSSFIELPPITQNMNGTDAGMPNAGGSSEVFFSPIHPASIPERKRILDTMGVN